MYDIVGTIVTVLLVNKMYMYDAVVTIVQDCK